MNIQTSKHKAFQLISAEFYLHRNNIHDNRILSKVKNIQLTSHAKFLTKREMLSCLNIDQLKFGRVYNLNFVNSNIFIFNILNIFDLLNEIYITEITSMDHSRIVENVYVWEYLQKKARVDLNLIKSPQICEAILELDIFHRSIGEKRKYDIISPSEIVKNLSKIESEFPEEYSELSSIFDIKLQSDSPELIVIWPEKMVK